MTEPRLAELFPLILSATLHTGDKMGIFSTQGLELINIHSVDRAGMNPKNLTERGKGQFLMDTSTHYA